MYILYTSPLPHYFYTLCTSFNLHEEELKYDDDDSSVVSKMNSQCRIFLWLECCALVVKTRSCSQCNHSYKLTVSHCKECRYDQLYTTIDLRNKTEEDIEALVA